MRYGFFYGVTLGEALVPERIPYAREPRKLPVVLSADEVVQFLEAVSNLRSRATLNTAYAAGLRASEVAGLRIEDIDSARGVIQVLGILRTYWRLARPRLYLFPGRDEDHPIDQTVLHAACRSAMKAAGLTKRVTLRTPQLRDTSSRERNRYPYASGVGRSSLDYSGSSGLSLYIRTSSMRFSIPKSVKAWMPCSPSP